METLDGYTIEQWKVKYQLAEKRAQESAQLASGRLGELSRWSDMAERICVECGIEWLAHQPFSAVIIQAFRELKTQARPADSGEA